MKCQKCESTRIAEINGKTSDLFGAWIGDKEHDGYVPTDMGIGGGDYINIDYCLDCGQIQGTWPLPTTILEEDEEEMDEEE